MTRQHARILLTAVLVTSVFAGGDRQCRRQDADRSRSGGLEPDLQAVVPHHLGVQNTPGCEYSAPGERHRRCGCRSLASASADGHRGRGGNDDCYPGHLEHEGWRE